MSSSSSSSSSSNDDEEGKPGVTISTKLAVKAKTSIAKPAKAKTSKANVKQETLPSFSIKKSTYVPGNSLFAPATPNITKYAPTGDCLSVVIAYLQGKVAKGLTIKINPNNAVSYFIDMIKARGFPNLTEDKLTFCEIC